MFCLYSRQGNIARATALLAIVSGVLAITPVAHAQMYPQYSPAPQYGYNTAGGWVIPVQAHGYAPGYCPCPPGVPMYGEPAPFGDYNTPLADPGPVDAEGAETDGADDSPQPAPVEDMPDIDLSGDTSFASAPQSAIPNAIGDSFGPCGHLILDDLIDPLLIGVCAGGDRFKATHNNSAVPQTRVFYNYNRYNNALGGIVDGGTQAIDVERSELGYEVADCCNLVSFILQVPFSHTIYSFYDDKAFT